MSEERRPGPFEPIKINLVEDEVWKKKWDTASGGMDWLYDSGWDDFKAMDLVTLEGLIANIASIPQKGKKKSKLKLDSDQIAYLAEQLKDGNDKLEQTQRMIVDAATLMYEAAAIPNNSDVEEAMEKAKEVFIEGISLSSDLWQPVLAENVRRGPKDWSPRKKYDVSDILKQLSEHIKFEREKNHWDRYLVFEFWEAKIVQQLFSMYKGAPDAYQRFISEFKWLADGYVSDVLKHLEKIMEDVDISNRTDWHESWKSMLTGGEAWGAQDELMTVLLEKPEETQETYDV